MRRRPPRSRQRDVFLIAAYALLLLPCRLPADEEFPQPYDTQKVVEPFLSPAEALAGLRLPPGFQATLFASEPEVAQPIALTTDERGRLWIAENYTYAEAAVNFAANLRDRIVILEDHDGDGRCDARKVFWNNGRKLTSIELGSGGVYALCPPQLLFIPDANHDDVPDGPPVVLLDGWDDGAVRHNIANGLKWGPDGWLYGRHGILATSLVGPPGASASQRVAINCGVWRYHPATARFEVVAHGTTNPWGLDWDEHGEPFFINTVIGHLWHLVPGARYRRMYGSDFNPRAYELIDQTADHFHWDTREQWSDIRKGVTDTTSAAGGGHAHSGLMIYLGDNWPRQYRNAVFTVNLHGRRLNRDALERSGSGYVAHHQDDFAFWKDPWFRGIDLVYGHDGGVYVADWSDTGECHENDGVHRSSGRIYKITHGAVGPQSPPDLGAASDLQLAEYQLHGNEWYARQARRLLRDRAAQREVSREALDRLRGLNATHRDAAVRLRALWCLWCAGAADQALLFAQCRSSHEHQRAWGVRLLADRPSIDDAAARELQRLAQAEQSGLVRLYLAAALPRLVPQRRLELGLTLARQDFPGNDRTLALVTWYALADELPAMPEGQLRTLFADCRLPLIRQFAARRLTEEIERSPKAVDLLIDLLVAAATAGANPPGDSQVHAPEALPLEILEGMSLALRGWRRVPAPEGWPRVVQGLARSPNSRAAALVRELSALFGDGRALGELRTIAEDSRADPAARRQALRALIEARVEGLPALLHKLLADRAVDLEAVRVLAAVEDASTPGRILEAYPRMDPETRAAAVATLSSRVPYARALLEAVNSGRVRRQDVSAFHARQIRNLGDLRLAELLDKTWGEVRDSSADRQAQRQRLKDVLGAAELARANLPRGRAAFSKVCANCHVLFGQGQSAGPDLTGSNRANLDYLLENIVDPSASVAADFRLTVFALADGRVVSGVVVESSEKTVTVRTEKERITLRRDEIDQSRQTNTSLMPEGLLETLSADQVRDLIAYLMSPAQVPLPDE